MQADPAKLKLVHHTALAFTVEKQNEQVQALRQQYDPAFQRWQPHINIKFPFADVPDFPAVFETLQKELGKVAPFDITFRGMDCFPNNGTVFLVPETTGTQLYDIEKAICAAIPDLVDKRAFHPHMTVGKFPKGKVQAMRDQLSADWKEWVVRCDGIFMIHRGKDTPFETYKKIEFLGE